MFGRKPPRIPKNQRAQPKQETKQERQQREAAEKRAMAHKRNLKAQRAAEARKRAIKEESDMPVYYDEMTVDRFGRITHKRVEL